MAAILKFARNGFNILKTVRDRVILSKFLTLWVLYTLEIMPMNNFIFSNSGCLFQFCIKLF